METKKKFIVDVIYYGLILGLIYVAIHYCLPILLPFIIAFLIALLALNIVKKVIKKDNKVLRIIVTTILFALLVFLLILLAIFSVNKTLSLVEAVPSIYRNYVDPALDSLQKEFIALNSHLPASIKTDFVDAIGNITSAIKNAASSLSSSIVSIGTTIISDTTTILLDIIIVIVSTYFLVLDYENIMAYLEGLLSPKAKEKYLTIKDFLVNNVFAVVKSYLLIMLITFAELFLGFEVLKIDHSFVLALLICILDILPVLGVGTVLIPWGVIALIIKHFYIGIGVLLLYLVITIVRNIIEPKLVGATLGLHPLATLFSMIVGLAVYGVLGLFGFPLFLSYLVQQRKKCSN